MGLFKVNANLDFKISFKKGNIKNMNQGNQNDAINAACAPRLNLDKISMLLYRSARKILEEKSGRMIFNMMENFIEENIQRCLDETQEIANDERKVLEQETCYNFGNAVDDDNFDKNVKKIQEPVPIVQEDAPLTSAVPQQEPPVEEMPQDFPTTTPIPLAVDEPENVPSVNSEENFQN